ncbi:MAG: hypothetical protein JWM31_52 [Solirubrobacterales bacterium]|nr:hypothetical protein [Solirubrobacterales bacterium]
MIDAGRSRRPFAGPSGFRADTAMNAKTRFKIFGP